MADPRDRSDAGALARARRFLGRVLDTVRGSEPPDERVPASTSHAPLRPMAPAHTASIVASSGLADASPSDATSATSASVAETVREDVLTSLDEGTSSSPDGSDDALAESWSGLRVEHGEGSSRVAWRDLDASVNVLRVVEVRCALGALDAAPEVAIHDREISPTHGATELDTDALRLVVALGSVRDGRFVSSAHATLR